MAYNELLADRISLALNDRKVPFIAKKMMGGWTSMVNDKMCVGVIKNDLMARIDPNLYDELLASQNCRPMEFTGRPMRGYLCIDESEILQQEDLDFWVDLCLEFNPRAKSSKRK